MKDERTRPTRLVEHDAALGNLLESLLAEVPEHGRETPSAPPAADPDTKLEPSEPLEPAPHEVADSPPPKTSLNPASDAPLTNDESGETQHHGEMPAWAREPFRVLLFRIGELRFAIPLILMCSVTRIPDRLTQVPAQPAWHRGVARYREESVVVADLGLLLGLRTACPDPAYLLVIGDGREAIACDAVEEAVVVTADQVRWRRAAGQPWLSGLLVDHMCGLLDAEVIGRRIRHG